MPLAEAIQNIAKRTQSQSQAIANEEATKTALVMPFIQALGYDVFNPSEVIPELTADIGTKKGEKIDYALANDGNVAVLIECKPCDQELDINHASQLFRYFAVTEARFGVLTNGVEYRFFADLDKENRMDERPFFIFNILDYEESQLTELARFRKEIFDTDRILNTATHLKYLNLIKAELRREFDSPSEELVKALAKKVYDGRLRSNVMDMFTDITRSAVDQVIRERFRERLKTALEDDEDTTSENAEQEETEPEIVTTESEHLGFNIVRAIGSEVVNPDRIAMRDAKSYCAILFDDNNRKPVCRLHFNTSNFRLSLFQNKEEDIVDINEPQDIFNYRDRIKATIQEYMEH